MGLISRRKNKTFSYQPRYAQLEEGEIPFKISQRFDKYRSTLETPNDLKGKFKLAWEERKNHTNKTTNQRVLIISVLLVILFICFMGLDILKIFSF